jgi:hypothetical protein
MQRLIATNSVPWSGADTAPTTGTPQYATDGNPGITPPTIWPAYAWNMVQEEFMAILTAAGVTPSSSNWGQVLEALEILFPVNVAGGTLSLYISPSGNDSNPGTSASPFLTIAGAVASLAKYNLNGLTVTLNLAAGSYAGYNFNGLTTPCPINVIGAAPGSTTLTGTGGAFGATNANAIGASNGANITISGVTLTATGSGGDYKAAGSCLAANTGASITIGSGVVFGSSQSSHIYVNSGGRVSTAGLAADQGQGYTIAGSALYHILSQQYGNVIVADATITLTGTPTFTTFAVSNQLGYIGIWGNTFTGSATGTRYTAGVNGVIFTNGAASTYLPGSVAGAVSTGGVYA